MADTLRESLISVLEQITDEFEVIVIDDGSTDNSKAILKELCFVYKRLNVYYLEKDKSRRLGKTRNISFIKALGEWCIFHIDTDDVIGPYILDFVKIIEVLSGEIDRDCLYSGKQIHMAKRDFLISRGPFKNIYRGEDRDLYQRLALSNQWITLVHERFIVRMARQKKKLVFKIFYDNWDQTVTDMQFNSIPLKYLKESLVGIRQFGLIKVLFRFLFFMPAYVAAKRRGIFAINDRINDNEQFARYREVNSKTLSQWQNILGISDDQFFNIDRSIFY